MDFFVGDDGVFFAERVFCKVFYHRFCRAEVDVFHLISLFTAFAITLQFFRRVANSFGVICC